VLLFARTRVGILFTVFGPPTVSTIMESVSVVSAAAASFDSPPSSASVPRVISEREKDLQGWRTTHHRTQRAAQCDPAGM
jgi:hypothetical protein